MRDFITNQNPDIVMLTETKRQQIIDLPSDMSCKPLYYSGVQLDCTGNHRGGLMIIIKRTLRIETA